MKPVGGARRRRSVLVHKPVDKRREARHDHARGGGRGTHRCIAPGRRWRTSSADQAVFIWAQGSPAAAPNGSRGPAAGKLHFQSMYCSMVKIVITACQEGNAWSLYGLVSARWTSIGGRYARGFGHGSGFAAKPSRPSNALGALGSAWSDMLNSIEGIWDRRIASAFDTVVFGQDATKASTENSVDHSFPIRSP